MRNNMDSRSTSDAIFCSSFYQKYKNLLATTAIQNVRVNSNNITFLYAHQAENKTIVLKAIFLKNAVIIHSKYEHRAQAKNYCSKSQISTSNQSGYGIKGFRFRSHQFTVTIRHRSHRPDPDNETLTAYLSTINQEFILRLVTRLTIAKLQSEIGNLDVLTPLQEAKDTPTEIDNVFHLLSAASTPVKQCVFSNHFPSDESMFTPDFPRLPEEDNQILNLVPPRTCAIL